MLSFILRKVLRRGFLIPLSVGFIYPTFTGDIVARQLALGSPALVKAGYLKADVEWSTVFDDVVQVNSALFKDLTVEVDVEDPLSLVRLLKGSTVKPKVAGDSGQASASPALKKRSKESVRPLAFQVKTFLIENGVIELIKGESRIKLRLENAQGGNVSLPLGTNPVSIKMTLKVANDKQGGTVYPVLAELAWDGEVLQLNATFKDFPLELLASIIPKELEDTPALAFFSSGSGSVAGALSGRLRFRYEQVDGKNRWYLQ